MKLPIHDCDCFETIRYDTKRYIFVLVRLFRSFNALLTCLLACFLTHSFARIYAHLQSLFAQSLTRLFVHSLGTLFLSYSLSHTHTLSPSLCGECRKTIETSHTYKYSYYVPTIFICVYIYIYSHVSLELVL